MLKALLIACLRFYRFFLSPWIGQQCRFTPTCSLYAIEAIKRHGAWHGLGLAVRRVARCHPWSPGGYDSVPPICSTSDASRCTHCHRTEHD